MPHCDHVTVVTGGLGVALEIIQTPWTIEGDPDEVWRWGAPCREGPSHRRDDRTGNRVGSKFPAPTVENMTLLTGGNP